MSYIPDSTGNDLTIPQGTTFSRYFTVKDSGGLAVDLTSEGFTIVRCEFRTDDIRNGGVTTGCPQPTMSFSDPANGEILMVVPAEQTETGSPMPFSVWTGRYDIEIENPSYAGYGSPAIRRVERVVNEASWTITEEVTD